jgi:DHA2 family multidrug resistance protein
MLVRHEQVHRNYLVHSFTGVSHNFQQQYQAVMGFLAQHTDATTAGMQAYKMLERSLDQQAALLSYVDDFRFLGFLCLLCAPIAFAMKRVRKRPGPSMAH